MHALELGFLEVGGDPEVVERDDGEEVLADGEVGAEYDVLFVDDAGGGREDAGVGEIEQCLVDLGLGLLDGGEGGGGLGALRGDLLGTVLGGLRGLVAGGFDALLGGGDGGLLRDEVVLGFDHRGVRGGGRGYGGVVLLAADDVLFDQRGVALHVLGGLDGVGLGFLDAGGGGGGLLLGLRDAGLVGADVYAGVLESACWWRRR